MGECAVVDFDRDIATVAVCSCGESKDIYMPLHKLRGRDIACPKCGKAMSFESIHSLDGSEAFLDKKAADVGIPPLHIISGRCGMQIRHFEFSGDKREVFAGM